MTKFVEGMRPIVVKKSNLLCEFAVPLRKKKKFILISGICNSKKKTKNNES